MSRVSIRSGINKTLDDLIADLIGGVISQKIFNNKTNIWHLEIDKTEK